MYEIYAYTNGDLDKKLLVHKVGTAQYQVMNPKLTREVSKAGSLTFVMTRDHPQYDNLPKMRTVVSVHQDGAETWRGRVLNHDADWLNRRAVYCEGALSFFNDSCITPFVYEGKLAQFLQHLIDAHNAQVQETMKRFQLGTVSAALGDLVVSFGDADEYGVGEDYGSTWEIISKLVLKTFGGYVYCTFDANSGFNVLNYCDEAYEADRQTAQTIEYGQNLLDLKEKTDTNNLMTRIYPVGNKHTVTETKWKWKILWWGKKYTESHEERYGIMGTDKATIEKYLPEGYTYDLTEGYIQSTVAAQKFGVVGKIMGFDTDSDNDTFAAGVQALQQNSAMTTSYTIRAVDLVDAGYNTERLTFASFAHIISAPHSVDAIMLCSKLVEPLDNPSKKEFTFGMTRRTLTDRHVDNLGKTNLLDESNAASESYNQQLIEHLKKTDKNVTEAAKTATNFLEWSETDGLIVRHESLPDKRVQILNDGIRVMDGSSMVNIQSNAVSITDGMGSCSISSGAITFNGIRNSKIFEWPYEKDSHGNPIGEFTAQTTKIDLSSYSSVMLVYDTHKGGTWLASGGSAGRLTIVLPVNGQTYSYAYPWNTVHWREVTVSHNGITFGNGNERTSDYKNNVITGVIHLEVPISDGVNKNDEVCRPLELYGFM